LVIIKSWHTNYQPRSEMVYILVVGHPNKMLEVLH
jgi:hypothetical protein